MGAMIWLIGVIGFLMGYATCFLLNRAQVRNARRRCLERIGAFYP
jgi:hypothetical protein